MAVIAATNKKQIPRDLVCSPNFSATTATCCSWKEQFNCWKTSCILLHRPLILTFCEILFIWMFKAKTGSDFSHLHRLLLNGSFKTCSMLSKFRGVFSPVVTSGVLAEAGCSGWPYLCLCYNFSLCNTVSFKLVFKPCIYSRCSINVTVIQKQLFLRNNN